MEPIKILIIDDDHLFLQTTKQQIDKLGFTAVAAADEEVAERLLNTDEYSLIFLDLRLGEVKKEQ